MKKKANNVMKAISLIIIYIVLTPYAVAAEGKTSSKLGKKARTKAMSAKKTATRDFLQDAASRSGEDHGKMKQKVHEEKANRQAAWAQRGEGAIEIQGSGAFAGMDYLATPGAQEGGPGAGEIDIYDKGKDLSGLQSLKSKVDLDNTDADIDAELEEVSRGIDSDIAGEKVSSPAKVGSAVVKTSQAVSATENVVKKGTGINK